MLSGIPVLSFGITVEKNENGQRPNIVVIMADDLGTNELSCYGGKNLVTPNIDRIANEGVRMVNNFASCTMSVPIRASLYTGLYPVRNGTYQNHRSSSPDIKSITHYLPEIGYRVGRTGKTHTTPKSVYQFEEIPGFTVNCVAREVPFSTDEIEEYMTRNDQPFCLFVCSTHPHMPWTWGDASEFDPQKVVLPPNCVDNEETRELFCNYLAEIRSLDIEVGAVLETLEKIGKLDNTLIIFLGEQGPQMPFGKWTCFNYGQHSAFVVRYPQKIKAGTTNEALVQYEDIVPTLIEFAGGTPDESLDGRSCLSALYGKTKTHRQWAYGIHNNIPEGPAYPIRSIQDKRYKLILNLTPDAEYYEKHMMNIHNKNKQVWGSWLESAETDENARFLVDKFVKRPAVEFYDLKNDPWEIHNLAGEKKYQKRISGMKAELQRWMAEQGDTGANLDVEF